MENWMQSTISHPKYHGARFYKCALQVNPFDYSLRHGKDSGATNEGEYNQKILQACQCAEIKVVGLAGHGNVETSEKLRQLLRKNDIVVFPGFEISSSEKIHMVCLFSENTTLENLNHCLGALAGNSVKELGVNPTTPSSLPCLDIAPKVKELGGFWFAPHMDGKNGMLEDHTHWKEIWKKHDLVRVGALSKDIENISEGIRHILENKDPNYQRERPIAIIQANDVSNPADLHKPKASCWIKMTTPTFNSFIQAFFDKESRVSLQIPKIADFSRIESIEWSGGGFFQDSAVKFSPHLNTVIGGRGAGKSSFLESVRYVLNQMPVAEESAKIFDSMVGENLKDSKITIRLWSHKQAKYYSVSRRFGEIPQIKNEEGELSHLTVDDILSGVDILGQNEILEISRDEEKVRNLLDRFLPDADSSLGGIEKIKGELRTNRVRLLQLEEECDKLKQITEAEEALKEQMQSLQAQGMEGKIKDYSHIAEEKLFLGKMEAVVAELNEWFGGLNDVIGEFPNIPPASNEWPNADEIREIHKLFESVFMEATRNRNTVLEITKKKEADVGDRKKILAIAWDGLQDELSQLSQKLPQQNGASATDALGRYKKLADRLAQIARAKQVEKKKKTALISTMTSRQNLLDKYRELHFSRFKKLRNAAERLNKGALAGKINIGIKRMQLRGELKNFLKSKVKGVGEAGLDWLEKTSKIDIVTIAKAIRNNSANELRGIFSDHSPPPGVADKIIRMERGDSYELEEVVIDDGVVIALNLAETGKLDYRPLDKLSTGQRCTAILGLFLLDRKYPLILDQPEDHLDNAFVAEHIVAQIREIKKGCQLILSTHNPNIPVFGDAELIAVLETDEGRKVSIEDERLGSIDKDSVKEQVARILDGGREAFNVRREKYGY